MNNEARCPPISTSSTQLPEDPQLRPFLIWHCAPLPLRSPFSLLDRDPGFAPGAIVLGPAVAMGKDAIAGGT